MSLYIPGSLLLTVLLLRGFLHNWDVVRGGVKALKQAQEPSVSRPIVLGRSLQGWEGWLSG
jgi:hypothetical protein